mmetsp:Transcript_20137/g.64688  ORF Transcript_20137/g.64688 Transcript_20137/m.64688 type:complete len:296 (-) Transcript_20137:349-1236(-)
MAGPGRPAHAPAPARPAGRRPGPPLPARPREGAGTPARPPRPTRCVGRGAGGGVARGGCCGRPGAGVAVRQRVAAGGGAPPPHLGRDALLLCDRPAAREPKRDGDRGLAVWPRLPALLGQGVRRRRCTRRARRGGRLLPLLRQGEAPAATPPGRATPESGGAGRLRGPARHSADAPGLIDVLKPRHLSLRVRSLFSSAMGSGRAPQLSLHASTRATDRVHVPCLPRGMSALSARGAGGGCTVGVGLKRGQRHERVSRRSTLTRAGARSSKVRDYLRNKTENNNTPPAPQRRRLVP